LSVNDFKPDRVRRATEKRRENRFDVINHLL
jgi:hypothetical protein